MRTTASLSSINKNLSHLMLAAEQGNTGKKILKPSDDPFSISSLVNYKKELEFNTQYMKNADEVEGYLNVADSSLRDLNDLFQRVKELVIKGGNEPLDSSALGSIADEIKEIREQVGTIANTKYGNKYIFGGISTNTPPYGGDPANWQLPADAMKDIVVDIDSNTSMSINVNGDNIFNGGEGARNFFDLLNDIENDLRTGDTTTLRTRLDDIDNATEQILSAQSSVGAKANRLSIIASKLEDSEIMLTEIISKKEDVDLSDAVVNLTQAEYAYKASLSISNILMGVSILDYFK